MKDEKMVLKTPPKFKQPILFHKVAGANKTLPHHCYFDVVRFGSPRKGEWFIDGVIIQGAYATRDFPEHAEYWIVRPTNFAEQRWWKGARV